MLGGSVGSEEKNIAVAGAGATAGEVKLRVESSGAGVLFYTGPQGDMKQFLPCLLYA